MKNIIIFAVFIIIGSLIISAQNKINVLIMPFKNNNDDIKTDLYSKMITDKIINDITKLPRKIPVAEFNSEILNGLKDEEKNLILSVYEKDIFDENYIIKKEIEAEFLSKATDLLIIKGYKKLFIPFTLKDLSLDENITDYHLISSSLRSKSIDLIIYGYYFQMDNKIRITFKVIDIKTDRAKIVYNSSGNTGQDIYDIIYFSINELIKKMNKEITPYSNKFSSALKDKQSRLISREIKENFLYFDFSIEFCGMNSLYGKRFINGNIDLSESNNSFSYSIFPAFNIEIYASYKNNYHGFGIKFNIPVFYKLPNIQFINRVSLSYILGFKKQFFFDFSIGFFSKNHYKYDNNNENRIESLYMGFYGGFNFRYMPKNYPFYLEAGINIFPLKINSDDADKNFSMPFWRIQTSSYTSKDNWISPVTINFGIGVFIKNDFGIFLRNHIYFLYTKYYESIEEHGITIDYRYLGEDLSINYDIELGMMFKIIFK